MKRTVKRIALAFLAVLLIVASCLPMLAFEVKRYYGDVDNDGNVTVTDARTILLMAIGLYEDALSEQDLAAADVNADGSINLVDARTTLRMAAQLEARVYMPSYEFDTHAEDFTALINEYRKTNSDGALSDYMVTDELCAVADQAAMEFALQTGTALRRGNGTYFNTLLDEKGVEYSVADKVVCVTTTSYGQCYNKMLSELQTRKAFLSENFKEIGIGAFSRDGRTVYWCIIFIG